MFNRLYYKTQTKNKPKSPKYRHKYAFAGKHIT